jgi:hypothetical protein
MAREYTRVATGINANVAPMLIAADSSACHSAMSPSAIRVGITSGEENGRYEATVARVDEGSWTAPTPMKNDAMIRMVSGVIVAWRSSWRGTIAPATANSVE